jgi:hypothetical protein
MPTIAIVDDREHARESLQALIEPSLSANWSCIAIHPFKSLSEYVSFLLDDDKEIAVLILDEKLHEAASKAKVHADYTGTQLAKFLRERLPEFPIYLITSFKDELKVDEGLFEELFDRTRFMKEVPVHVKRMERAGLRFSKAFESELGELSKKAKLMAEGRASTGDKRRAEAIREKLEIAFPLEEITTRGEWLSELNVSIQKLELLSTDISSALKKSKKNRK